MDAVIDTNLPSEAFLIYRFRQVWTRACRIRGCRGREHQVSIFRLAHMEIEARARSRIASRLTWHDHSQRRIHLNLESSLICAGANRPETVGDKLVVTLGKCWIKGVVNPFERLGSGRCRKCFRFRPWSLEPLFDESAGIQTQWPNTLHRATPVHDIPINDSALETVGVIKQHAVRIQTQLERIS